MKVNEAMKKVCPFMSGMFEYQGSTQNQNCICNDCMAWVEIEGAEYTKEMLEWVEFDRVQRIGKTAHELNEWYAENPAPDNQTEKEGYCKRLNND